MVSRIEDGHVVNCFHEPSSTGWLIYLNQIKRSGQKGSIFSLTMLTYFVKRFYPKFYTCILNCTAPITMFNFVSPKTRLNLLATISSYGDGGVHVFLTFRVYTALPHYRFNRNVVVKCTVNSCAQLCVTVSWSRQITRIVCWVTWLSTLEFCRAFRKIGRSNRESYAKCVNP